jgi:hypothetical protein
MFSYDERTHSAPVKTMSNPIFRLVGVWNHYFFNMLCFGIIAGIAAAIVDVHMSPHRVANQIAQHGRTIVVRREFPPFQLKASPIWSINSPPRA